MANRGRPKGRGGYPEDDLPVIAKILEVRKADLATSVSAAYKAACQNLGLAESETQLKRIRRNLKNLQPDQEAEEELSLDDEDDSDSWDQLTDPTFRQYLAALEGKARAEAVVRRQKILEDFRDSVLQYQMLAKLHSLPQAKLEEGLEALEAAAREAIFKDTIALVSESGGFLY